MILFILLAQEHLSIRHCSCSPAVSADYSPDLIPKPGQNKPYLATRLLFQNTHLFHPLPGLHDFLFQPLAASSDNSSVPSDSFLLLPKAKVEIPFNFYPQITWSWQMAEVIETWAEPQVTIQVITIQYNFKLESKAALHLLCTYRWNSTPIS